jgi:hypothetical protein
MMMLAGKAAALPPNRDIIGMFQKEEAPTRLLIGA